MPLIHRACHFITESNQVGQPFAVDTPLEVLLVVFHFPNQIQFQVSFGFPNPISVHLTVSLYSSQSPVPASTSLCSLSMFEFIQELLVHPRWPLATFA